MPSKLIRIHSKDRDAGQSTSRSNFVVELKEKNLTQQIKSVRIVSAHVPNVFYNVNSLNNTISIQQDGEAETDLTLTVGQYTISTFITMAKSVIDAGLTGGSIVTITQGADSKLLTLSFSGGTNPNTALQVNTDSKNGWCVFGLSVSSAEAASHTVNSIPNLRGLSEVYVHSKELNQSGFIDGDTGSISAFCQVDFSNTAFGAMGHFQSGNDKDNLIEYSVARNLSRISIRVRDSEGNILDTGCSDVVVILRAYY